MDKTSDVLLVINTFQSPNCCGVREINHFKTFYWENNQRQPTSHHLILDYFHIRAWPAMFYPLLNWEGPWNSNFKPILALDTPPMGYGASDNFCTFSGHSLQNVGCCNLLQSSGELMNYVRYLVTLNFRLETHPYTCRPKGNWSKNVWSGLGLNWNCCYKSCHQPCFWRSILFLVYRVISISSHGKRLELNTVVM